MDANEQQQFMQLQQQLQNLMLQKENLKTQKQEISKALEALDDIDGDEELYKSVGNLLISRDRDTIEEELSDEQESLDRKIDTLERKENQLKEKVQDAQQKFAGDMQGSLGG